MYAPVSTLFCSPALATAQWLRTECGPGWPAALPGAPVRRWDGVDRPRSGHRHGCRCLFARTGVRSKSPAPAHGLAGQESGKRQAGWPFSWVTFSLATQRESDSAAAGRRKLLAL